MIDCHPWYGSTVIGLFQGMFEQNILTFNPGSGKTAVYRLVQADEAALDGEKDQRRLRGVVRNDQGVGLADGFVDERAWLCNPVMFQVPPVTTQRKAPNGTDVVVSTQRGARKTLQVTCSGFVKPQWPAPKGAWEYESRQHGQQALGR